MPEASDTAERGIPATLVFDGEAFDRRCRELGATTETARAELAGVDRKTLWNYRKGMPPSLPNALDFAARVGLAVTDIWKEA